MALRDYYAKDAVMLRQLAMDFDVTRRIDVTMEVAVDAGSPGGLEANRSRVTQPCPMWGTGCWCPMLEAKENSQLRKAIAMLK